MKELNIIQTQLKAPKGNEAKGQSGRTLYRYRSCEDILEAVKDLLKEQKCILTITDEVILVANRIYIKATATITNEKGDSVSTSAFAREPETLSSMNPSQVTGAASSYARKYALNGLLAIDDNREADDVAAANTAAPTHDPFPPQTAYNPAEGSLAMQKEEQLIEQVKKIMNLEELRAFYSAAPESFRRKESRFYQAVTNQAIIIENA